MAFFRATTSGRWKTKASAPDIDIENWPKDVIAGHDPQLERAVDEACGNCGNVPSIGNKGTATSNLGPAAFVLVRLEFQPRITADANRGG